MKGTAFEAFAVHDSVDHSLVEGIADSPYTIPSQALGLTGTEEATSVLWWRSEGHTHTAYVVEVMMDLAAKTPGKDAVEYRLDYLTGEGDAARKAGVLKRQPRRQAGALRLQITPKASPYTNPLAHTSPRLWKSQAAPTMVLSSKRSPQLWIEALHRPQTRSGRRPKVQSDMVLVTRCATKSRWMVVRWSNPTSRTMSRCASATSRPSKPTLYPPQKLPLAWVTRAHRPQLRLWRMRLPPCLLMQNMSLSCR